MAKMKKQRLTKLVALYFAGSLALGGVAYAADTEGGNPWKFLEGETTVVSEAMGESEQFSLFGGSLAKEIAASNITLQSGGGDYLVLTGGGSNQNVGNASITVNGGLFEEISGGSSVSGAGQKAQVENATIRVTGMSGIVENGSDIFGGGDARNGGESIVKKSTIVLSGGTVDGIIGGGTAKSGSKAVVNEVSITISGGTSTGVYGGGLAHKGDGSVSEVGKATINISGGTVGDELDEGLGGYIQGGGWADVATTAGQTNTATVKEAVINVAGGTIANDIYGGGIAVYEQDEDTGILGQGQAVSHVENVTIAVSGNPVFKGEEGGSLFAGGKASGQNTTASVDTAQVTISGNAAMSEINGGGDATGGTTTVQDSTITVKDQASAETIYGGGFVERAGTSSVENATIVIEGGTVGSIYAGGYTYKGGTTTVDESEVIIRGGTITGVVKAGGYVEDTGTATVGEATITLDVDNAAVTTDGSNAGTSILHLTDKAKTYDGARFSHFNELEVDGTSTITGGLNDKNVGSALALTGDGVVNADVSLKTGTVTISSGTLKAAKIDLSETGGIALGGGNLWTNSGQVFETAATATDSDGKLTAASGDVKDGFGFNGGTLTLDDAKYTEGYLTSALSKVNPAGTNTTVAFTGALVDENGQAASHISLESASTIADNGGVLMSVPVKAKEGTTHVSIGGNTGEEQTAGNLSASQLQLDRAASGQANQIDIVGGKKLLLKGSGSQELVTDFDGNRLDKLSIAVGDASNSGTLAVQGGALHISDLTATSGSEITVGDSSSAGTLVAENVNLGGGTLFLDPAWQGNDTIEAASKAGIVEFVKADGTSSDINGTLAVGQNSVLSLGTADTTLAEKAFAESGLTWGEDITSALYIGKAQTLENGAKIEVNGALEDVGDVTVSANDVTFAKQSLLMVDVGVLEGATALTGSGTLTAVGNSPSGAEDGAQLYLVNASAGESYAITGGFNSSTVWEEGNIKANWLVGVEAADIDSSNGLKITPHKEEASKALPNVALPNILNAMEKIDTNSDDAGIKFLSQAVHAATAGEAVRLINAAAQGAENAGATRTGVVAAWDIANTVESRLSLAHESESSAEGGVWAQYVHNKDEVDGMAMTGGSVDYSNSYNGIVVGGDFARRGAFQSGVAFAYGSGDGSGSHMQNDFDFWGLSYYGSVKTGDNNLLFDVGYSKTSHDISGLISADPDTKVFTLGVKGEKQIVQGSARYVPYVGLRYMNIDTGSYTGTINGGDAFHYTSDKANLWLLPVGVSVSSESANGAWTLRPTADLSYVFAMGDRDSAMGVTVPGVEGVSDRLGYDIMDSGFFVGSLGLEAEKDNMTCGIGYAYQKGSHAENNRFYANVKFSF